MIISLQIQTRTTNLQNKKEILFRCRSFYSLSYFATKENPLSLLPQNQLLVHQRPVLLRGVSTSGHVWVCDGAHYWTICNVTSNGNVGAYVYLHFHMNWGWGGNYNGWYSSGNFNIPGKGENYNSGLRMIYNIVPN